MLPQPGEAAELALQVAARLPEALQPDVAPVDRVQIGDDIGGWKVSEIEGRRLVLSLDGRSATFTLFSDERGKQPPDDSVSKAADKLQNVPQRNHAQEMAPQAAESQPAASRRRRRTRE